MASVGDTLLKDPHKVDVGALEEVLYRNERTLVTRRPRHGNEAAVVFKQAIGTEAVRRLRHEINILQRLSHVDGVVRIAPAASRADTLALQDEGGVPLSELMKTSHLPLPETVDLACALSRVLAGVHRAGVVHKDINPSNILVTGPQRQPTLIDFNIASSAAEERPGFTHQSHIAGTLSYMSPEQTGRTGRSVDQRADLYSLGVTLYELTTGRKPFTSEDLLELVHDHLVSVPAAPATLAPDMPRALSDIVMRLLEKEPDRRYQSADGLAHDLQRVRESLAPGALAKPFALGQHDFASRLSPPSRLIGRGAEILALRDSIDRAIEGRCPCLLVAGAPGVGKTALINELRPLVTARRGWFVSGKFDQYRQDAPTAALEALRGLGRLLLAEPEERLVQHRERIIKGLGANVGFGPALLPEFVLLLGKHPRIEVADPREAEARMIQATVDLLASIASPERPVVMVHDDVQWAPAISQRFLDAVITASIRIPGLLVVGAYRSNEVDAAHPLSVLMARWHQLGMAPPKLALSNLPPADISALVAEMLRLPGTEADALATALEERTDGNPYDTVELINALRQDGLLTPRQGLWDWDASAIRRYVGDCGVVDLLGRRLDKLAAPVRQVLEVMACLGGDVPPDLLQMACDLDAEALPRHMAPALEEGLLIIEQGNKTELRFRHDRVQQAVFERMDAARRCHLHLELARRLVQRAELGLAAAEQYLPAVQAITDEAECRHVIGLFQHAAARSRVLNFAVTEKFLGAAIHLLKSVATPADNSLLAVLESEQHKALYGMGRLEEGDQVYASIVARCAHPLDLVEPAGVQMYSLANRSRYPESMALGLNLLGELGMAKPDDPRPAIGAGFQRLAQWHRGEDKLADFERPVVDDPRVLAWAKIIIKTANAAYFCDLGAFAWLILEANRLWIEHGPCAQLMPSAGAVPFLLVGLPQDYRGAYVSGRHMVSVGEARGFEPGTSVAHCILSIAAGHWVEPIENVVKAYRHAREDLMRAGDFPFASYTYLAGDLLLDCASTLEPAAAEVDAGLAFATRTGNVDYTQRYLPRRQLIRALRGETSSPGYFSDDSFDEAAYVRNLGAPGTTSAMYHVVSMISAAIFGDIARLTEHGTQAMPILARTPGYYITALARVLQAMALAERARALPPEERASVLEELDTTCLKWLALRAADAPDNFLHLLRWVEAERTWAVGNVWEVGAAFDAAMQEAALHPRPWHRALITERAALFQLGQGMEHSGRPLLAEACSLYEGWGATGKVAQMRAEHGFLRSGSTGLRRAEGATRSTIVATDVVDMMAVLRVSQALSSETSISSLTSRLAKVLGSMTGATNVQLVVRPDIAQGWFMAVSLGDGARPVSAEEASANGELPLSVFRYAERTREVLLIDDATHDDRFADDPCIAKLDQCSMLLAPILSHGELRAILVLENRMRRAAFSVERLDSVTLIAGQLSVSLDNALLYDSLERKVAERTAALEDANRKLEQLSLTDALTGLSNRRRFNEALDAEWLRAKRTQCPLSLAIIDIDFFKLYNDHYGHQGGDACLQLVAKVLATGRRGGSDLAARYGGEEFVLLLPNTDQEGCYRVAERVRADLETLMAPHLKSSLGIVTISVGVASVIPQGDAKPFQFIELADAAMYEAKRAGRNRVVRALTN